MALDVGELVAYTRVDFSKTGADIAKGKTGLNTQAGKAGEEAGKSAGVGLSRGLSGALKSGLALGAGFAAFAGVTKFLDSSTDAAKDLNETVARTNVVFGTSQQSVTAWAASTDKSLGLSKQAALEYAAQLGNLYEQLGFTAAKSADLSEQTTTLAVKIGAFKNVDPSQVVAALESGYRGQLRAIQRLVPGLTAAQVAQEALTESGKKNATQLTAQDKATAILALVQKDAGNATAFFAETSGELARQQKIANAEFDNAKAALGEAVIPLMTDLAKVGANDVIPFLTTAAQDTTTLTHQMGPLASATKGLVGGFGDLPGPVKEATGALVVMTLLRPKLTALTSETGALGRAGAGLRGGFASIGQSIRSASQDIGEGLPKFAVLRGAIGSTASAGLRGAGSGLLDLLGGPWGVAFLGATAAVGVLISKHEQGVAEINSFTTAVEQDSGALGVNTRAAVVNALAKTQAFKDAKALGISLDDLTNSLLGQAAAQDRVNGTLDQYPAQLGKLSQSGTQAYRSANDLRGVLGDTGDKLNQGVANAKDYASALGDTSAATDGTTSSQDNLGTAVDGTTTSVKTQTAAVKTWIEKMDDADNAASGLKGSTIAYRQSIADAEKALKSNGKTLDLNTQKGRDNASALLGIATAATAHADAMKADGKSNKATTAYIEASRTTLYNTARQFGLTKTQAHNYVNQLLKIPKSVHTSVSLSTSSAMLTATKLGQAIVSDVTAAEKKAGVGVGVFKAGGGEIGGAGGPTSDNQLIFASPGEFVVKASAYKRNKALVNAINAGAPGFAKGGQVGRYASGGAVDFTTADIGNIFGAAGASHASHSDVTAAIHSRTVATNSLLAAEHSLRVEQAKKHPSEAAIHADERRILADRQALTAATTKLKSTEASYKAGQASEITKVTNAATSDVKTVGTFIKNLQLLTARGFGALAQVIYSEYAGGDQSGAEAAASGAVKETSKQLSSLTNSFAASAKQQAALAQFGSTGSFTAPASTGFRITSGAGGLTGSQFANLIHVETMQLLSGAPGDIANTLAFKLQALG